MPDNFSNITDQANQEFRYVLVGNIIDKHHYGEKKEIRSGIKQFRAGAKVYLLPEYGGMGHESIPVYGQPRKRWKRIKIVIRSVVIKDVRVKKTFDPQVIDLVTKCSFYSYFGNNEGGLNSFAESINRRNIEIV